MFLLFLIIIVGVVMYIRKKGVAGAAQTAGAITAKTIYGTQHVAQATQARAQHTVQSAPQTWAQVRSQLASGWEQGWNQHDAA